MNAQQKITPKSRADFNLYNQSTHINDYYEFFNNLVQNMLGNKDITIRQVVTNEDFSKLSDARIKMYGQRDGYLMSMYPNGKATDESDLNSYVFACYLKGEIIGSQRVTPVNYEVKKYIDEDTITNFLGDDHHDNYVEFSRLVVDKSARVRGAANAIVLVAGAIIALTTKYSRLVSYSKPKVDMQMKAFSIDDETIRFKIEERENNEYILYKKDMLEQLQTLFNFKDSKRSDITSNLHNKITEEMVAA
jgi:hypothetical protein